MLTRNTIICMIHRSRLFYFVRDWKYLGMWRKMNKDFMKNVMIWEKKLLKAGFSSILWELISAWQDSIVEYLVSMISSSSSAPRTNTPSETLHTSKSFTHKGWFLGLEKKLGNACRYFNKDVRITTAMLLRWEKNWNHPLSAVKMCKNPTEEDLSEIQETVVEILEVERVDAIRLDLLNSFNLIWFDANGEYFRGFDNPACVPPIFTNDQFPTLVIKFDWRDCHRKHHSLVSLVLELRYSKWTPLWLGALFEGLHWTQTTRNNTRALSQAHDVPAKIIASISADLSTKNRICIFWFRV